MTESAQMLRGPAPAPFQWSEREVMLTLLLRHDSRFHHRNSQCVIPNASHGFGLGHEADLILISKRGVVSEIEIKISRSDFRADAAKAKHDARRNAPERVVSRFWYAMPAEVWARCADVWRPDGAGVIAVQRPDPNDRHLRHGRVSVAVEAKPIAGAGRCEPWRWEKAAHLMSLRYWEPKP